MAVQVSEMVRASGLEPAAPDWAQAFVEAVCATKPRLQDAVQASVWEMGPPVLQGEDHFAFGSRVGSAQEIAVQLPEKPGVTPREQDSVEAEDPS
jgi:hypothetical protein